MYALLISQFSLQIELTKKVTRLSSDADNPGNKKLLVYYDIDFFLDTKEIKETATKNVSQVIGHLENYFCRFSHIFKPACLYI